MHPPHGGEYIIIEGLYSEADEVKPHIFNGMKGGQIKGPWIHFNGPFYLATTHGI